MDLRSYLDNIVFFSCFTDAEKKQLLSMNHCFIKFKAGEFIIREEDFDNTLFIILKGSANVFKNVNSQHMLATMGPGTVFGEISFLTHRLRTTNVVASEETICFRINRSNMDNLSAPLQNRIKDLLINVLVQRLDQMNQTLLDTVSAIEGVVFTFTAQR